jgi:rRNA-processing protein EBP2
LNLESAGVKWRRPTDFYAEMVKSDEHMEKVARGGRGGEREEIRKGVEQLGGREGERGEREVRKRECERSRRKGRKRRGRREGERERQRESLC